MVTYHCVFFLDLFQCVVWYFNTLVLSVRSVSLTVLSTQLGFLVVQNHRAYVVMLSVWPTLLSLSVCVVVYLCLITDACVHVHGLITGWVWWFYWSAIVGRYCAVSWS